MPGPGWKKKEKPLTMEEAVALARKQLAPYWLGSDPLLAAVRQGGKATVYPLDPAFLKSPWLLFFLDLTNFSGDAVFQVAKEWHKRYSPYGVKTLLLFRPNYLYLRDYRYLSQFFTKRKLPFISVMDMDGALMESFGVTGFPKVVLHFEGHRVFERTGRDWLAGSELELQGFLRQRDPGLPLLPPSEQKADQIHDVVRIDFGAPKTPYPKPGFIRDKEGMVQAQFGKAQGPETLAPGQFSISGRWTREADRIITTDPEARITLKAPGSWISIIAQSVPALLEVAEVAVELNGMPIYEQVAGSDLGSHDSGSSVARVTEVQPYQLLRKLPEGKREVVLQFPSANRCGIALYGLCFADG